MVDFRVIDCVLKFIRTTPGRLCFINFPLHLFSSSVSDSYSATKHDPALQNADLARKQASWVTDQLVWDHIQERKHHGTIELPKL